RWAIVFALGRSTSRSRDVQTILKRGLRDEDASVRSASAQAISLHQKNGGNLIPALFHALKKEHHHDALNEMLRALQKWPAISQRVSDVLLGFLHHPDEGLQQIAIRQCSGFFPLSEELCERLLDIAYHHASPEHRRDAAVALFFGPPSFQQTLLEKTLDILCKQEDDARQNAAFVLHCSGYGAAAFSTYIVAACGDSVDVGELHLLQALQHVEKPPKGILSWVRKRFAQANVAPVLAYPEYVFSLLEKMDPDDLVDLVGQLYDEVRHVYFSNELVASFLRILGRIGPASEEVWPILTHFIEGGECSEEFCLALASFGDRALPLLLAFVAGRKEREVVSALRGLAKLGSVAEEHFSEVWALRSAKSRAVRAAACAACLEIDEERAFALGVLDDLSCASCGPVVARHMSREGLLSTWSDWEDFLQRGDCSFQARVEASILSEWFEREEQHMFVVEAALHTLRLSSVSNTQIEVLLLPVLESLRTSHQLHDESFLNVRHVVRAVSLSHCYIAQYSEKGERVKRVFSWLDDGLKALASGEREEFVEFAREAVSLYKLHTELHPVRGNSAKKEWLRQWKSVCAGWERHKVRKGSVSVSQEAWEDVLFGG
ncbi:MAG TPA: hypothetical protein DCE42_01585, partial [Myxococcales bacterium]|nr:hypothetical protein [Myxococcales bacterium]